MPNKSCYECSHIPVCARCVTVVESVDDCVDNVASACGVEGEYDKRRILSATIISTLVTELCEDFAPRGDK
jgi:hypothetical protein